MTLSRYFLHGIRNLAGLAVSPFGVCSKLKHFLGGVYHGRPIRFTFKPAEDFCKP